jgi:hypothetical protein
LPIAALPDRPRACKTAAHPGFQRAERGHATT